MCKAILSGSLRVAARLAVVVALLSATLQEPRHGSAAAAALQVVSTTPPAGSMEVPASGFISITFDRPVVTLGDVGVAGAHAPATIAPPVAGQGRWINTSIWSYQVPKGLAPATQYLVATKPGLTATDGSQLVEPYSFGFSTLRPGVLSTVPVNGTAFALPRDAVQVVFNQPVQHASAEAGFTLLANRARVPGRFAWNGPVLATQPDGSEAVVPRQQASGGSSQTPPLARDTIMTFHPARALPLGARAEAIEGPGVRSTAGPLPMTQTYVWQYSVAGPLSVVDTTPFPGATGVDTSNGIRIRLSAPIDQALAHKAVHIIPKVDYASVYTDQTGTALIVNADFLPSVTYRIVIDPARIGIAGQSLPRRYTMSFTTQPAPPSITLVSQGPVAAYDAYRSASIYARVVNLPSILLSLYHLNGGQFQSLLSSSPSNWHGEPPAGLRPLAIWQVPSQAALSKANLVKQPLMVGGRPLAPGYYLVDAWNPANQFTPADHLLVLITRTSVTLKVGQHQVFVWATDLRTGKPVRGESVRVLADKSSVLATGRTDRTGVFQATVKVLRSNDSVLQHAVLAELTRSGDVAACSLDWNNGVSPWDFNLRFTTYLQPVRMHLTTERPIYRPGQPVYFKGIARQDNDGRYSTPPAGKPVKVTVRDARYLVVYQGWLSLDRFGGFSGKVLLGTGASLGTYYMAAVLGNSSTAASFEVAAYEAPTYALSVISDRGANADYVQGEKIGVQVRARYYFGAPVAQASVAWNLTRNSFYFSSALFPDYSFGDYDWVDSSQQSSGGQRVTQGAGMTYANGDFHFAVPASIKGNATSQQFTLEAIVTGPDNQQVAQQAQVAVHKSAVYVGLKPAGYVLTAGKATSIRLVAVADDDSRTVSAVPITVKLYKRVWMSRYVRDSSGFYYWQSTHKDTLVATYLTRSGRSGTASVLVRPNTGGEYVVVATASDSARRPSVARLSLWCASAGAPYVAWQPPNNDRIRLVPDKQSYKPGNVAHILVTAPLAGVTALVTVERGGVLSHQVLTLRTNSSTVSVPIVGLYAPDVYVSVTLVKGPGADTNLPEWKLGYVTLPVDISSQKLHVSIHAYPPKAKPGQKVTFAIHTLNALGRGVRAELAVALVDKAVLALASSSNPTLLDTFYRERDLGVESAGSLTQYIDRLNLDQQLGTKGGGGGGAGEGPAPRAKFPDTAYWNPSVVTDAHGNASVTVVLPDNLTTWTFSAIGSTASTQLGESSLDLISSKDLLLEPALPRFLTLGDSALAGAVVDNLTGKTQMVAVRLHVSTSGSSAGAAVPPQDYTSTVKVPAGGSRVVQWPVRANAIGAQTFLFAANAFGSPSLSDSLQVSLPVEANTMLSTTATSGVFSTKVTQLVDITSDMMPGEGDLTVTLSPSPVSGLGRAASYLVNYPYDCSEQTTSRIVGLAEAARLPSSLSGVAPSVAAGVPLVVSAGLHDCMACRTATEVGAGGLRI